MSELQSLEKALIGLASVEEELEQAERAAEIARLRAVQKIYKKRSTFTSALDKFWHIVLSQHPDFSEYIRAQDFKYVELINDISVQWDIKETEKDSKPENFSIIFKFDALDDDFPAQTIVKKFELEKLDPSDAVQGYRSTAGGDDDDDDEEEEPIAERLTSEAVDIVWPKSYDSINPKKITDKKTPEGKKNYRTGMKSFFGWFKWTGKKPGKEFPSGDDLARLFADDIFPNAVRYYTEAQRDGLDEEVDSDASEPLDLSDGDNDEVPAEKKRRTE